jgi:hypothetical protein
MRRRRRGAFILLNYLCFLIYPREDYERKTIYADGDYASENGEQNARDKDTRDENRQHINVEIFNYFVAILAAYSLEVSGKDIFRGGNPVLYFDSLDDVNSTIKS